uniref:Uncharacterized protein n=1 Tax=Arundo donax TaxID=35708 RepID=A0A0A9ES77_ARUDO
MMQDHCHYHSQSSIHMLIFMVPQHTLAMTVYYDARPIPYSSPSTSYSQYFNFTPYQLVERWSQFASKNKTLSFQGRSSSYLQVKTKHFYFREEAFSYY